MHEENSVLKKIIPPPPIFIETFWEEILINIWFCFVCKKLFEWCMTEVV